MTVLLCLGPRRSPGAVCTCLAAAVPSARIAEPVVSPTECCLRVPSVRTKPLFSCFAPIESIHHVECQALRPSQKEAKSQIQNDSRESDGKPAVKSSQYSMGTINSDGFCVLKHTMDGCGHHDVSAVTEHWSRTAKRPYPGSTSRTVDLPEWRPVCAATLWPRWERHP